MDEVTLEVLNVFEHFVSNLDGQVNGLYKINLNGSKATIFRNGDSWGVLSHCLREPVTKCMGFMRNDRIELVENAINKYMKDNK